MKESCSHNCKMRWLLWGAMLVAGVGFMPVVANAQANSTGRGYQKVPQKRYYNKRTFKLPIHMSERSRAMVKQVILYVKEQNGPWQRAQAVPGSERYFRYQVGRDGRYWFSVVTVDNNGRSFPADVTNEPADVLVIVDTQPPLVRLTPLNLPGGKMAVQCKINDTNADFQNVQMLCSGTSTNWTPLQRMPGSLEYFQLPGGMPIEGTIRCTATDLAKNTSTKAIAVARQTDVAGLKQNKGQVQPIVHQSARKTPPPVTNVQQQQQQPSLPALPPNNVNPQKPKGVVEAKKQPEPLLPPPNPFPGRVAAVGSKVPAQSPELPLAASNRQLVNSTTTLIQYQIEKQGPSGVSKVDIWVKGEQDATWRRLSTDMDRRSPANVTLPGEGTYGIRLVVTNGNGFGGRPPLTNDTPDFWIEVDKTPPHAQLHPIDPVTVDGAIELRWSVSDKNLTAAPISLYYATTRGGAWHPIARGLENNGKHRWQFPRTNNSQFFIRLEAADQAGNLVRAESPSPVVLDTTIPRVRVVGVSGVTQ